MRFLFLSFVWVYFITCADSASAQGYVEPPVPQRIEAAQRYGIDTASPLESRVQETPASVLKMFEEAGGPRPTPHKLTAGEQRQLVAAFAALPPLHQRILREHLRSISFLDGMPNTGLTSRVNPEEVVPLFDITIRAAVFHQTASEWLTEKERTCFDATGSPWSVSVEAGKQDAIVFVLLHEATHVVDSSLGLTPTWGFREPPPPNAPHTDFTRDVWSEPFMPVPEYRDTHRASLRFFGGKGLPIAQAEEIYASLRHTPFVSLYGSRAWSEDLAEYLSVYHWTQIFKQPYRIVLRQGAKQIFVYEPMKSPLVRRRIDQMKPFYKKDLDAKPVHG